MTEQTGGSVGFILRPSDTPWDWEVTCACGGLKAVVTTDGLPAMLRAHLDLSHSGRP